MKCSASGPSSRSARNAGFRAKFRHHSKDFSGLLKRGSCVRAQRVYVSAESGKCAQKQCSL